jgi:hypothetical protein
MVRVRDWKSELLFGVFELGNNDRWRPVGGWLVGGLPWEVGAAGSFASMLGNDDPWQCVVFVLNCVAWVG